MGEEARDPVVPVAARKCPAHPVDQVVPHRSGPPAQPRELGGHAQGLDLSGQRNRFAARAHVGRKVRDEPSRLSVPILRRLGRGLPKRLVEAGLRQARRVALQRVERAESIAHEVAVGRRASWGRRLGRRHPECGGVEAADDRDDGAIAKRGVYRVSHVRLARGVPTVETLG